MTGTAFAEHIEGGAGNDTIRGNGGADSLVGGAGDDTVVFLSQGDFFSTGRTADGGAGFDTLRFGFSGIVVDAMLTNAIIAGITNFEAITLAGSGATSLTLGSQASNLFGVSTLTVRTAGGMPSLVLDASGLVAGSALDVIGTTGADTIIGTGGNDTIRGNGGADSLVGGAGD
ncbi:MAG: hypothetical protein WCP77_06590, partial [Roseococcus sp.]